MTAHLESDRPDAIPARPLLDQDWRKVARYGVLLASKLELAQALGPMAIQEVTSEVGIDEGLRIERAPEEYYGYVPGLAANGLETAVLGQPQMYGMRLRYRFGAE